MKKLVLILGIALLFSCKKVERTEVVDEKPKPELLYETEHCRYYCLQKNGFGTCKVITCDCDEGYSCDASTSW